MATLLVGNETISAPAVISVPVTAEQLVALVQGGDARAEITAERKTLVDPKVTIDPEPPRTEIPVAPVLQSVKIEDGKKPGTFRGMSDDEIREAFDLAGIAKVAAETFGVTTPAVYQHIKRLSYRFPGNEAVVKPAEPIKKAVIDQDIDPEAEARLTQRAIEAGIWHVDEDGQVIKHARIKASPAQSKPTHSSFNPPRRKVLPPSTREENLRLIDEAIREGRITKVQPGYADGATKPLFPKSG